MATPTEDSLTGQVLREDGIEETFRFKEAGDPRVTEIGDGLSYTANLYDSNNNLVGTKDITFDWSLDYRMKKWLRGTELMW